MSINNRMSANTHILLIHSKGLILLTVMIYLVILSLLALGALETSALQTRMANNIRDDDQLFICAESTLQQSKNNLTQITPQKCFIAEQSTRYYVDKNAKWWQTHACTLQVCKNYKTFYLIENLPEQPCFKIGKYAVGARYYRITARANYNENYQTVLQSTVLLPFKCSQTCPASKIISRLGGQQSWRQIY